MNDSFLGDLSYMMSSLMKIYYDLYLIKKFYKFIKWVGLIRPVETLNCDQDLRSAFKNSTFWYYQALARRVGGRPMKDMLVRLEYGNKSHLMNGLLLLINNIIVLIKKIYIIKNIIVTCY
jgi:hypothetical protein